MDRRLFLISTAAAAMPLYAGPLVTFSESEGKLVEALTDAIIPADDVPGARAAGVVFYIDKQLGGALKRYRAAYSAGIPKFEADCREATGKSFAELEGMWAAEYLIEHTMKQQSSKQQSSSFFTMVVDHTMQGFYGSPDHGGNRGEASWKMLGIEDVMRGHKH